MAFASVFVYATAERMMAPARSRAAVPSGPRRPRGAVNEVQRARLLSALSEIVEADELAQPTVAQIINHARVSRKTFYDIYADREDCFLDAFEQTFALARALAADAYERQSSWREGVRAGLACLLGLIDEHPGPARLCLVHSLAAGERVQVRRDEIMHELAGRIDLGRGERAAAGDLPDVTAEAVLGGAVAVIHCRLVRKDARRFSDLLGPLMSMITLPYLGAEAACEEQHRSSRPRGAARARSSARPAVDPLVDVDMRLTYRTVRVLTALAQQPDASNRQVGANAGITDQGQISKLLARLASLGLVENHGVGQAKGGANAWYLTAKGRKLERATRPRVR